MKKIKGESGILIKPVQLDSADLIFSAINNSREHLRKWLPFVDQTKSVSETQQFILSQANAQKKDEVYEIWVHDEFAGLVGFKEIDKINLNRLMIKVARGNTQSIAIPTRLGFTFEGIERNGELLHGQFVDLEVYSLLKSDK